MTAMHTTGCHKPPLSAQSRFHRSGLSVPDACQIEQRTTVNGGLHGGPQYSPRLLIPLVRRQTPRPRSVIPKLMSLVAAMSSAASRGGAR